jgi:DNA-binding transcriptional LysR family regulator
MDAGRGHPALVPLLEHCAPPPLPVHLLYLQDPYPRRRLASLVDFLVAQLGSDAAA